MAQAKAGPRRSHLRPVTTAHADESAKDREESPERWSWAKSLAFMVIVSGGIWLGILTVLVI